MSRSSATSLGRQPAQASSRSFPTAPGPQLSSPGNQSIQALHRSGAIRAKLEIGGHDDPQEREANAIAERVMRSADGACCSACADGGGCEDEAAGLTARRSAVAGGSRAAARASQTTEAGVRGSIRGGEPLSRGLRGFFEPRLGRDLGDVRVHRGAEADRASRSIGARAFALGNNIAFADGQWSPDTTAGRTLIAHELAHVAAGHDGARRDFDFDAGLQGLTNAGGAAVDALGGVADRASKGFSNLVTGAEKAFEGAPTLDDAKQALGDAASSIGDTAKELALRAANAIAKRYGGRVELTPRGLEIILASVELFKPKTEQLSVLEIGRFIPLLPVGFAVGPLAAEGALGLRLGNPTMTGSIGPGRLQNVRLVLNPATGVYIGEGELYVGGAVAESVEAAVEVGLAAEGVIPMDPPIPIVGTIEGGIRGILRGVGKGGALQRIALQYSSEGFQLSSLSRLQLGALLELDLEVFLDAMLEGKDVCHMIWPARSYRLAEKAEQYELPLTLKYADGEPDFSFGEISSRPIPVDVIETAFRGARPPNDCMGFEELVDFLCKHGKLPKELCDLPKQAVGFAQTLPFPDSQGLPFGPLPFGPQGGLSPLSPSAGGGHQAPVGSKEDPIEMVWLKPLRRYHNPIYLLDGRYSRNVLKKLLSGKTIGVPYWPEKNDKLERRPTPRGGVELEFARALTDEGYDGFEDGDYSPDHVLDLFFKGPDHFQNLWPLDRDTNARAGLWHWLQPIKYNYPSDPPTQPPREGQLGPSTYDGVWFVIKSVKDPP